MYGLLEIGIAILLLAAIFLHPAARDWISQVRRSDRCAVIAILAVLMTGQVINESRTTFPFVRWSMYTEPFEDEPIVVGKFQALHADGTKNWINLARYYPSISRNSHDRLALILQRRVQGKLSHAADEYFGRFMLALGERYQRNHHGSPVIEVRAILQTVLVKGNTSTTNDVVVKALHPGSAKTTQIARSN